jgi:hypothetical protein
MKMDITCSKMAHKSVRGVVLDLAILAKSKMQLQFHECHFGAL